MGCANMSVHTGARPSISSKKMMAGCWRWASSNSMRSWRSASPTHLDSTSAPLRMKKATFRPARLALAASARATSVFPVPACTHATYETNPYNLLTSRKRHMKCDFFWIIICRRNITTKCGDHRESQSRDAGKIAYIEAHNDSQSSGHNQAVCHGLAHDTGAPVFLEKVHVLKLTRGT